MSLDNFYSKPESKNKISHVIALLLEICRVIESKEAPDDILTPILLMLSDFFSIEDGVFTIFDSEKNEIYIDIALGLSDTQQMKGRYKLGEGITGEVVKTGKAYVVPQINSEPKFLSKTKTRKAKEYSFICVPITYGKQVCGTLSVTLVYNKETDLEMLTNILTIITSLVSQPLMLKKQLLETQKKIEIIHRSQFKNFEDDIIIGNSRNVRELKARLYAYAKTEIPVLFVGDRGTGKTFWANVLHHTSVRKNKVIVQYTCTNFPADKVISTLFGIPYAHLKEKTDSYISTTNDKNQELSLIKQAENSTLLIENIELLSDEAQSLLLKFLQTQELIVNKTVEKIFTRLTLSTSVDLKEHAKNETFNKDLYKILSTHSLNIPSIKERKDDIVLFADKFLQEASQKQHKNIKRFSTTALDLLCSYHWPGNLNEMQQVIVHSAHICEGGVIHAHMLPPSLQSAQSSNTVNQQGLQTAVAQIEKDLIIDTLKVTRGNMKKTSTMLKISDRILGLRMKKYSIKPTQYR